MDELNSFDRLFKMIVCYANYMPDYDENVNSLLSTNDEIGRMLANKYGNQIISDTYALLANADFYDDVIRIRDLFGIDVAKDLQDDHIQQYIVECMVKKYPDLVVEDDEIQKHITAINKFRLSLMTVLNRHRLDDTWVTPLEVFIAKGEVNSLEIVRNIVNVARDMRTKELIIRISPLSTSPSEDLKTAMRYIRANEYMYLPKRPSKPQLKPFAKRNFRILRELIEGSNADDLALKYNLEPQYIAQIKDDFKKRYMRILSK